MEGPVWLKQWMLGELAWGGKQGPEDIGQEGHGQEWIFNFRALESY